MSSVKWIKITTNMFEDEKIDFIESLPEADSILIIWIKLLTLAGKCNAGGFIFLTENIPYTEEMLSHKFRRPHNTVKFALRTLHELEMIEFDEESLKITNWEKHQNIEGLERIREQNRLRKQKQREREKLKELGQFEPNDVTGQSHESPETDIDLELEEEIELDIDKDIDKDIYKEIIAYLNTKANKNFKASSKASQRLIRARINEGFTIDDFKKAIDTKVLSWGRDPKMNGYLRPQTLFGTKFEGYLNEDVKEEIQNENNYGW